MLWDQGTWEPVGNPERDLARGNLTFNLQGKRLKGRWHLVRLRSKRAGDAKRENWLLIKGKDEYADADGDAAVEKFQKSVISGRGMEGIAKASGKSWGTRGARKKSPGEAADAVKALKKKSAPQRRAQTSSRLRSARAMRLPGFIAPQLATLVSAPPRQGLREDKPAREIVREKEKRLPPITERSTRSPKTPAATPKGEARAAKL